MKFLKPSFRIRPEGLYAINMTLIINRLIIVLNPIMFLIANIHKSVIAPPLVRMNNAVRRDLASYNGLQNIRKFGYVLTLFGKGPFANSISSLNILSLMYTSLFFRGPPCAWPE